MGQGNRFRRRVASSVALEGLEHRRILAANLGLYEASIDGNVVSPGDSLPLTVVIQNTGDQNVIQTFAVQLRLVRTDAFGVNPVQYDSPSALDANTFFVEGGVNVGAFHTENVTLTVPSGIAAGTYGLVMHIDSNNAIPENDNNNNFASTEETVFVIGADKIAVIDGTDLPESFTVTTVASGTAGVVIVARNGGSPIPLSTTQVNGVVLKMLGGNDAAVIGSVNNLIVDGGDGNDRIAGGVGNETLIGGAGKDVIDGGLGNDRLNGNGGNDKLIGGAGSDRLYGYAGNDYLDGGSSSDRLEGGLDSDTILGQGGNDKFFCRDGFVDYLFGASGIDVAQVDGDDVRSSIESVELA